MAENNLLARLDGLVGKYEEIELLITDPAVIADMRRFVKLNKEYKELGALMEARARYMQLIRQLDEAKDVSFDSTSHNISIIAVYSRWYIYCHYLCI